VDGVVASYSGSFWIQVTTLRLVILTKICSCFSSFSRQILGLNLKLDYSHMGDFSFILNEGTKILGECACHI